MNFSYYESVDAARDYLDVLENGSVLALDTEFIRTRTFFPIPALYQINCGGNIALLDATDQGDWSSFSDILRSGKKTIVMHACGEDLEVFARHFQVAPMGIFDTQVAHSFVSETFSVSYANLVNRVLQIELGKHETRSNWLQRPLSRRQLHYAVDDVRYLPALHQHLLERLNNTGRMAWFDEEMSRVLRPNNIEPEDYFRSLKRAKHLKAPGLSKLRMLCAWREKQAREEDIPRGRVVKDEHLVAIADMQMLHSDELVKLLGFSIHEKYLPYIDQAFQAGRDCPSEDYPKPSEPPLTQIQGEVVKKLKSHASSIAEKLGMAPELLGRKRDIEATVRQFLKTGDLAEIHTGWREEIVGHEFARMLKTAEL